MTRNEAQEFINSFLKMRENVSDKLALQVVNLYPEWKENVNCRVNDRIRHKDILYRVITTHTSQKDWTPDVSPSLFEVVNVSNVGTIDDPIPYNGNMTLENGKYYSQDSVIYLCNRDTVNPVYNPLFELVGLYVETVDV